jgi:hypothetical protein
MAQMQGGAGRRAGLTTDPLPTCTALLVHLGPSTLRKVDRSTVSSQDRSRAQHIVRDAVADESSIVRAAATEHAWLRSLLEQRAPDAFAALAAPGTNTGAADTSSAPKSLGATLIPVTFAAADDAVPPVTKSLPPSSTRAVLAKVGSRLLGTGTVTDSFEYADPVVAASMASDSATLADVPASATRPIHLVFSLQ